MGRPPRPPRWPAYPKPCIDEGVAPAQGGSATDEALGSAQSFGPQLHEFTDYLLRSMRKFRGSAAGGFYLPERALSDPRYRAALDNLTSPDGRATYLLVYGHGDEWGTAGAHASARCAAAVEEATKEGTLTPTGV